MNEAIEVLADQVEEENVVSFAKVNHKVCRNVLRSIAKWLRRFKTDF